MSSAFEGANVTTNDDDRFGMPESAMRAAAASHAAAISTRVGTFIPTRRDVATLPPADVRRVLIDWMHESPSELIPSADQIRQVEAILAARTDACELASLIEECREYVAE
jgi:hypothetical protein